MQYGIQEAQSTNKLDKMIRMNLPFQNQSHWIFFVIVALQLLFV